MKKRASTESRVVSPTSESGGDASTRVSISTSRSYRLCADSCTELDINLLDESELYDASIIASLFKEWIRELPEDIFPKDAQHRITSQLPTEIPDKGFVPEVLRRELQHLPPFNYYLLFAITCHLSLLLEYQHKNKMTCLLYTSPSPRDS